MGSTSKWYGNAAYFDGNDYISVSTNSDFGFGTGDYTIEFWINHNTSSYAVEAYVFDLRDGTNNQPAFYYGTNDVRYYFNGSNQITVSDELSTGWKHYAFVRKETFIGMYVNGTLIGSVSGSFTHESSGKLVLGASNSGSAPIDGYVQDFRIYKGTAKYTTNFNPPPPMFGDYTRSTPNKIVVTPGSDYALEARNTSGITTSTYSATRQWGTKPEGGIYDIYASSLVVAIPGGAIGGATSTFDVTGQIRFETPTATYVNAGIVTYSNSLGIGTYGNKSIVNDGPVSISSTIAKYYSRSMQFNGSNRLTITSPDISPITDFTFECWTYYSNAASGNETNMEFSSSPINKLG